eukprot:m.27208 g.27208  ORF g.27208 m.27208 type:complete len:344 (+) comp4384_c0_seq1:54-1085(+)
MAALCAVARHAIRSSIPVLHTSSTAARRTLSLHRLASRVVSGGASSLPPRLYVQPAQQCAWLGSTSTLLARARPAPSGGRPPRRNEDESQGVVSSKPPFTPTHKSDDEQDNSLDARLDRSQLATLDDVGTQRYVAKVFREAGSTVGVTTAAAVTAMGTGLMISPIIPMLGGLIPLFMFYQTSPATHSAGYRYGLVATFAGLQGLAIAPLVSIALSVNPMLIPTALGGTVLVFGGASLASLLAPRASMLRFGSFLGGAVAVMVGFSLLGLGQMALMGAVSPVLYSVTLYGGLALMCAFVGYDTQRIIEDYREGNIDPLKHGVDVFINFIGIFRRLLAILLQRED